jgi:RsiW-degrading membrane proteinase PrsW (M82 family)
MLHIGLSGWVGYGIVSAFEQKRPRPLLGSLLGAIALHGIWNSMTLVSGLSASSLAGETDPSMATISVALALSVMAAVLLVILVINVRINRSLLRQAEGQVDCPERGVEQPTDLERG